MTDLLASTKCLANLPPIAPRWLWPDRIPKGKITLLAGSSGSGKTFIALDLAARITTNRNFPNPPALSPAAATPGVPVEAGMPKSRCGLEPNIGNHRGSVLLITPEEDLLDNIRPRLEAATADTDKCIATTELELDQLKNCADRIEDLKLIIIDPLSFLIANDNERLSTARKLFDLYQYVFARSVAILALLPMYPGSSDPLHRIPNIAAIAPLASTIFITSHDHREENTQPNRRILIQLKNNLSPLAAALAFNIQNSAITWSDDLFPAENLTAAITPQRQRPGPDPLTLDHCIHWLYEFLAPQPRPQAEIIQAAKAAGFSYRTLRRAKRDLQVQSKHDPAGHWLWRIHPGTLDYDTFDQLSDNILRQHLPSAPA